ncbi:MAG: helix-turn-helix transcriptional regulator [Pseudomonadota bacterium]
MPDQATHDLTAEPAKDWYSNETATFGDRLAGAREALGLSDEALARKIGVKVRTLRNWEQDLSEPRANKLQMLAGILNVSFRWLLTGEGEGIEAPGSDAPPEDIASLLLDVRQIKGQLTQAAERLGIIEKRLQQSLKRAPE